MEREDLDVDLLLAHTELYGAPWELLDNGWLQLGSPEGGLPTRMRDNVVGFEALLEQVADPRFDGLWGLERAAIRIANPHDPQDRWRWDVAYPIHASAATTLHDLP